MKRICMLATNDILNDPRVQKEALGAVRSGFEVIVLGCVSQRTLGQPIEYRDGYKIVRLQTKIQRRKPKKGFLGKLRTETDYFLWFMDMNRFFAEAVKRHVPDIVHANDLDTLPGALWGSRQVNAKVLYDAHELWVEMYKHGIWYHTYLYKAIERYCIKRTNFTVTVNPSIAEILSKRYGVETPFVVRNCPWTFSMRNGLDLRQQLGINADKLLVIYQGRYDYERGLEELVMAGEYLEKAVIAFRGFGNNEDDLKQIATEKGLIGKKVFFLEPVEMADLIPSLHGSDIGVIPYKPFCLDHMLASPNKMFDYMMAGLALLSNNLPEIRQIIKYYNVGEIYQRSEPKIIAQSINRLSRNPDILAKLKANSLKAAKETFCWEREMQTLLSCYHRMFS